MKWYILIYNYSVNRYELRVQMLQVSTDPLSMPPPDGTDAYPEKLHNIVQDIAGLTLRETAQLNELIKV